MRVKSGHLKAAVDILLSDIDKKQISIINIPARVKVSIGLPHINRNSHFAREAA